MEWSRIQNDLWGLLTKKTEGESRAKIMQIGWGAEVQGYQRLHFYHSKQSGMAMNERMRATLKPGSVNKEDNLEAAIGWWKRK